MGNYENEYKELEAEKKAAQAAVDQAYGEAISGAEQGYQDQIDALEQYKNTQMELQNQQTNQALKEIEQQRELADKNYQREQSGAYVDWQKQSNKYGADAEAMAASGLANTGYSESSQVRMYNTYQNRVSTARESFTLAMQNYDNAMTNARLQNSSALAEIAFQTLLQQTQLAIQGFQYKNSLVIELANKKQSIDNEYYQRYLDLAKRLEEPETPDLGSGGNISGSGNFDTNLGDKQPNINKSFTLVQYGASAGSGSGEDNSGKLTYSDVAVTAADLRKKGAKPQEIWQYINSIVNSGMYIPNVNVDQDMRELVAGYVGQMGR